MNISFKTLSSNCAHQIAWRDGKPQCLFKNGKPANSFADWQECKQSNCCLVNPKLKEPVDDQLEGQMCIEDFIGGG